MANADRPLGLRPVRYRNGTPWNGQARAYYVTATNGTAFYIGDPVDISGASNTAEVTVIGGKFAPGSLPTVTLASAGGAATSGWVTGAIVSVMPTNRDSTIYREASTARVVMVADDPNIIFEIQDDASGALATTSVGLNADLVSGTGSAFTGQSAWELDATAPTATNGNQQLHILGVANIEEDNVAADGNAKWNVLINKHRYAATTVGA